MNEKKVQYHKVSGYKGETITAVVDGQMYVADDHHPNWHQIVDLCEADDPAVADLFDIARTVSKIFEPLTERISYRNNTIYFDGDEADTALTQTMLRFWQAGDKEDAVVLARFFEKLATNPSKASQDALYAWMRDRKVTILENGDLLAYKGVQSPTSDEPDAYLSIGKGIAIVDGVEDDNDKTVVLNRPGSIIEVPRSYVDDNIGTPCSHGLHVGTYSYASTWSHQVQAVLAVAVNPRDVVAVPRDSSNQKIRCCRYRVLDKVTSEAQKLTQRELESLLGKDAAENLLRAGDEPVLAAKNEEPVSGRKWMEKVRGAGY